MNIPAKRNPIDKVVKILKYQSWTLFLIIILVIFIDIIFIKSSLVWAKSFVSGSVLSFFAQYLATKITFRMTSSIFKQKMVNQFYLAGISRWLVTIVGFVIVFNFVKPHIPWAIILGYIIVQFSNIYILQKLK